MGRHSADRDDDVVFAPTGHDAAGIVDSACGIRPAGDDGAGDAGGDTRGTGDCVPATVEITGQSVVPPVVLAPEHGPSRDAIAHLAAHGLAPDGSRVPRTRTQRQKWGTAHWVTALILVVFALTTLAGLVALWPTDEPVRTSDSFSHNSALSKNVIDGTVALRDEGFCDSPSVGRVFTESPVTPVAHGDKRCGRAIINITSGVNAGKRTLLLVSHAPGDPDLHVGDKIRLAESPADGGGVGYSFLDFQRTTNLSIWVAIVGLAVALLGGWLGLRSLVGLVVTLTTVGVFLLPGLLHGADPLVLATITGAAALFPTLYLVHGFSWKTSSALAGTLIALLVAALLARIGIHSVHLRGLGSEDNLLIQLYLPDVTVTGLMLAGFIIGSLGVLNDVTISQASTVTELRHLDPTAGPLRLFTGAIRVGRDHIASIMYTLVLGYTGAALPLLLLLTAAGRPLSQVLTSDIMATEIMRSAVGALALCLAVPLTTFIAALTAPAHDEFSAGIVDHHH